MHHKIWPNVLDNFIYINKILNGGDTIAMGFNYVERVFGKILWYGRIVDFSKYLITIVVIIEKLMSILFVDALVDKILAEWYDKV